MATGHEPVEQVRHTVTVTCTSSGPLTGATEDENGSPSTVLADVEAFCAALRARGASDGLVIGGAGELSAVVNLGGE